MTDRIEFGFTADLKDTGTLVMHLSELLAHEGIPGPESVVDRNGKTRPVNGWPGFAKSESWSSLSDTLEASAGDLKLLLTPANNEVSLGCFIISETLASQLVPAIPGIFRELAGKMRIIRAKAEHIGLSLEFFRKHYRRSKRTPNVAGIYWLQYWGKREFLRQGGDAILENPYIQAEKIGDGVLIQVGEDPWQAHTPEGEELLLKATQALPPVIVDWGPGVKPLA